MWKRITTSTSSTQVSINFATSGSVLSHAIYVNICLPDRSLQTHVIDTPRQQATAIVTHYTRKPNFPYSKTPRFKQSDLSYEWSACIATQKVVWRQDPRPNALRFALYRKYLRFVYVYILSRYLRPLIHGKPRILRICMRVLSVFEDGSVELLELLGPVNTSVGERENCS